MNYQRYFAIAPRTSQTNPTRFEFRPTSGYLEGGSVFFPPGCKAIVGIRILANGYSQIAPPETGWLTGDNAIKVFTYRRRLEGPPYLVIVEGYNLASDWSHQPVIEFDMER